MQEDDIMRARVGIILGLLAQFIGSLLSLIGGPYARYGLTTVFTGTVLLVWGCSALAKGKGYSPLLGVVGVTSFIGVILLLLLPDRR